jgi:hypothetical protein
MFFAGMKSTILEVNRRANEEKGTDNGSLEAQRLGPITGVLSKQGPA